MNIYRYYTYLCATGHDDAAMSTFFFIDIRKLLTVRVTGPCRQVALQHFLLRFLLGRGGGLTGHDALLNLREHKMQ